MAVPLFVMVGATLFRAASKKLFNEAIKAGAKKATQKQIAKGGAKTLNSNNVGVIKTTLRPKSGGGAASPKTVPKTSPTQKPSGASSTKPAAKKPASTTTTKPTTKKSAVSRRTGRKKPEAKKQSALGTGPQRAIIGAASHAALIPNNKKTTTKKTEGGPGRGRGEGVRSETFGEAFKKARAKGVGTEFTFKGNKFSAVRDSDIPETIKGNKQERLRKFLTQRKRKAK